MKQEKNTEISARIAAILENAVISPNSFAQKLGYIRSQTIYDILNGKSAPSYDFFKRFMFSEFSVIYNVDWLITGRGDMFISQPQQNNQNTIPSSGIEDKLLAVIREQAEEIGQLRERINQMELRKDASDVPRSGIANVG